MYGVKTQADVRLELIEMEKAILAPGATSDTEMGATSLLTAAFDIEDAQYVTLRWVHVILTLSMLG